jgi:hypothetical protein
MSWFYIGWLLVKRGWDVGIDCFIGRKVKTIVYLLYFHTVISSIIFISNFLILDNANIVPLLYLLKQTIVKARPSLQITYFFISQSMLLVNWIYNDVSSFLHDLFFYYVISIVINRPFFNNSSLLEGEDCRSGSYPIIAGSVIVWSWLHF